MLNLNLTSANLASNGLNMKKLNYSDFVLFCLHFRDLTHCPVTAENMPIKNKIQRNWLWKCHLTTKIPHFSGIMAIRGQQLSIVHGGQSHLHLIRYDSRV